MFAANAQCFALVAQLVEHTLGKGEVSGSNPLKSSILQGGYVNIRLCFNGWVVSVDRDDPRFEVRGCCWSC